MQSVDSASLWRLLDAGFQVSFSLGPEKLVTRLHQGQISDLYGHPYQPYVYGRNVARPVAFYAPSALAAHYLWQDFERGLNGRHDRLLSGMAELMGPRLEDVILPPQVRDGQPESPCGNDYCAVSDLVHEHASVTGYTCPLCDDPRPHEHGLVNNGDAPRSR